MQDLPTAVLASIFSYLQPQTKKEFLDIISVCKKWHEHRYHLLVEQMLKTVFRLPKKILSEPSIMEELFEYHQTKFFGSWQSSLVLFGVCGAVGATKQMLEKYDPSFDENLTLAMAAANGQREVVELLLADARVSCTGTALILAAANGHREIVALFLEKVDPVTCSAFVYAARGGHTSILTLLLQDRSVRLAEKDNLALCAAAENGHYDAVQLLLQENFLDTTATEKNPIVATAKAEESHPRVIELLLQDRRFDPVPEALQKAVERGHVKVVEVLLKDERVDPMADNGLALFAAADCCQIEMVRLLLSDDRVRFLEATKEKVDKIAVEFL